MEAVLSARLAKDDQEQADKLVQPLLDAEEALLRAAFDEAERASQAVEDGLTEIPEGLALDVDGHPTVDPQKAFDGWLMPRAGTIGYGLGLLGDVLIGALAGAACGRDVPPVHDTTSPYNCGSFMLAIDPEAFIGRERFEERVGFLIDSARSIPPMEGFDRVRLPGERGFIEKEKRRVRGIPVPRRSWDQMMKALAACKLDVGSWADISH